MHSISTNTIVLASSDIRIPGSTLVIRKVFDYGMADCASIIRDLAAFVWRNNNRESADNAEMMFV